jgi:hypothetical protein
VTPAATFSDVCPPADTTFANETAESCTYLVVVARS